ncbi:MAG TPA: thioredoxin family protein [Puia sp.]
MENKYLAKIRLLILLPGFLLTSEWHHNLDDAQRIAKISHKYILLNFSGSDWCGPCIRLKKEFFESDIFKTMADSELVLVNADFPRNKRNQPSVDQQKINDGMADRYNAKGIFPYTLLLNADGKILGTWEGLPNETPENFIQDIHNDIYTEFK